VPTWQVPPGSTFHWREWDGDYVLYHEQSGDTHFLSAFAARVVECLGDEPLAEEALCQSLSADYTVNPDRTMPEAMRALLVQLEELGLVEAIADRATADPASTRVGQERA
jgi:PqqD family protein of HPr-rel-A system